MYGLDIRTARPFGRRRRGHQHGFLVLTPAVKAHQDVAADSSEHPEVQRFECARNPQGGTVTVTTARGFYARGSGECSKCCNRRQCALKS